MDRRKAKKMYIQVLEHRALINKYAKNGRNIIDDNELVNHLEELSFNPENWGFRLTDTVENTFIKLLGRGEFNSFWEREDFLEDIHEALDELGLIKRFKDMTKEEIEDL